MGHVQNYSESKNILMKKTTTLGLVLVKYETIELCFDSHRETIFVLQKISR